MVRAICSEEKALVNSGDAYRVQLDVGLVVIIQSAKYSSAGKALLLPHSDALRMMRSWSLPNMNIYVHRSRGGQEGQYF